MKLKVVVHPAEEGGYWAEIPALPGCISEGDTFDETLSNIRETAEGWLSVADQSAESDADAQLAEIEVRNDEDLSS
jgi:predicted RNase H-like HicB family nuclease